MENNQKIAVPCYVGETRTKAGIFLSAKIAMRKAYSRHLKLIKYDDFLRAEHAFLEKYATYLPDEKIKLNTLYSVREEELYSVFSTAYLLGIVRTSCALEEARRLLPNVADRVWWKHNLTYKEAQEYASGRFARYWKNANLYVQFSIKPYSVLTLDEVKKQNRIL